VLLAGFDNLPRRLRADIAAEAQKLLQTEKQFNAARDESRATCQRPDCSGRGHVLPFSRTGCASRGRNWMAPGKMPPRGAASQSQSPPDAPQAERLLNESVC